MGRLRHRTAPGCTYFVTTKTWANRSVFQVSETAQIVMEVLLHHRDAGAYLLHEFVIMPDHIHALLTPSQNTTLEKAMQLIKGGSSYEIHNRRRNRTEIWQPGFHEQTVRDQQDFQSKVRYIRMNPVVARLAQSPQRWPYSSDGLHLDEMPTSLASGAKAPEHLHRVVGAKAPTP